MKKPDYPTEYLIFGLLFMIDNRLQTVGDGFFEEITARQWFLLAMLELFDKAPTLGALSEAMGCTHQNTRQLAARLERSGLVKLERDERDGRRLRIKATGKSKQLGEKYREKQEFFMQTLFQDINKPQKEALLAALEKLIENLEGMEAAQWKSES